MKLSNIYIFLSFKLAVQIYIYHLSMIFVWLPDVQLFDTWIIIWRDLFSFIIWFLPDLYKSTLKIQYIILRSRNQSLITVDNLYIYILTYHLNLYEFQMLPLLLHVSILYWNQNVEKRPIEILFIHFLYTMIVIDISQSTKTRFIYANAAILTVENLFWNNEFFSVTHWDKKLTIFAKHYRFDSTAYFEDIPLWNKFEKCIQSSLWNHSPSFYRNVLYFYKS